MGPLYHPNLGNCCVKLTGVPFAAATVFGTAASASASAQDLASAFVRYHFNTSFAFLPGGHLHCFGRFHLGEGITKKESDLVADVEEQQQALQAKAAEKKDQPAAADAQEPQQPAIKV